MFWKNSLRKTVADLKSLKIQGASEVRKSIILAVRDFVLADKSNSVSEFRQNLKSAARELAYARPTEPQTRNALAQIMFKCNQDLPLKDLKLLIIDECMLFEDRMKAAKQKIAENALKLFKKNTVVFTHCHSHTVESLIVLAHKKGLVKRVIATETRPRLQGHITVSNLGAKGIPCTLIVDSAAATFLHEADIFITGADAITVSGSVVNKIGTSLISHYAKKEKVPHYVAANSFVFDPLTSKEDEPIEERPVSEVWDKKAENIAIRNPAFDVTEAKYVKGIISELGIYPPNKFSQIMQEKFGVGSKNLVSLEKLLQ